MASLAAALSGCEDRSENEADPRLVGRAPVASVDSGFVSPSPLGPGTFAITASGELLALSGYDFIAGKTQGNDPAFVDGWQVRFDHVLVTFDHFRLDESPDLDPADPSRTGEPVARTQGPWAVDLHAGGPLSGKGEEGAQAVGLTNIARPDRGGAFDPTHRYAASYDLVVASPQAIVVNLDSVARSFYQKMVESGWSALYAGTARYRGERSAGVFAKIPTEVRFALGVRSPASYINCQNPEDAVGQDGEFLRGVHTVPGGPTVVQMTVHTDHLFWDALNTEHAWLHFDPLAARASSYGGDAGQSGDVTLEDLMDDDVTRMTTRLGEQLPPRSLVSDYRPSAGDVLRLDPNGVGLPRNSYAAYLQYSARTQGHLNADGECYVKASEP